MEKKRLYRTEGSDKMLCGVCGGIAEYFDIDPTLVRVGWVIATLCSASFGLWVYIACAIIVPNKSKIYPGV
jgi:phage shock protein PspC (stress-responsive transcriptional regulator)